MPPPRKTTAQKNKRRITRQRPNARNQKRQIASTQNQIIAIKKHINLTKERLRWHCGFTGLSMASYPFVIPLTSGPSLTQPASVNTILGEPVPWRVVMTPGLQATPANKSKYVVNKQYVDLTITSGNEAALTHYTAFVVQLQPKTASQTYAATTSMSTLLRDQDYITPLNSLGNDSGYGAYINNDRYKIIKRLEFETLGIVPTAHPENKVSSASGDTGRGTRTLQVRRTQFKLNYGSTVFKSAGDDATGTTLNYAEINPEQKRFIVIFSDNSLLDVEMPTVSMSSLITGYSAE